MSASLTPLTFSRLAGVLAALWLCGAGTAWAGDGADLASLQAIIGQSDGSTGLCAIFGMKPCPQLPTITQGVLEVAGLGNNLPEMVRAQNSVLPGSNVTAGNAAAVPPVDSFQNRLPMPFPLNSEVHTQLQDQLSTLTPLAFVSQSKGTAVGDTAIRPQGGRLPLRGWGIEPRIRRVNEAHRPRYGLFFYDDLFRVTPTFTKGQIAAKFSLPLTVLNSQRHRESTGHDHSGNQSSANGLATCFNATPSVALEPAEPRPGKPARHRVRIRV